jgi:hypothetical protein
MSTRLRRSGHVSDQGAVQVEPVRIGFQRQPNLTLHDQHEGLV